jgi:hypothetical protein
MAIYESGIIDQMLRNTDALEKIRNPKQIEDQIRSIHEDLVNRLLEPEVDAEFEKCPELDNGGIEQFTLKIPLTDFDTIRILAPLKRLGVPTAIYDHHAEYILSKDLFVKLMNTADPDYLKNHGLEE